MISCSVNNTWILPPAYMAVCASTGKHVNTYASTYAAVSETPCIIRVWKLMLKQSRVRDRVSPGWRVLGWRTSGVRGWWRTQTAPSSWTPTENWNTQSHKGQQVSKRISKYIPGIRTRIRTLNWLIISGLNKTHLSVFFSLFEWLANREKCK